MFLFNQHYLYFWVYYYEKKKIKKERINNKKEKQTIHFELESNLSIEYTYVSLRKCSL